jgi:type I restriction enzyme M protein
VFSPYATVNTNLLFFEKGKKTKEVWYYEHTLPEGQKAYSKTRPIRVEEFVPIQEWWNNRAESEVSWKVSINTIKERGFDLDIKNPNKVVEEVVYDRKAIINRIEKNQFKISEILEELKALA